LLRQTSENSDFQTNQTKNFSITKREYKKTKAHEVSPKRPNAGRSSASSASKKARIASRTSGQDFAGLDALPGMAPDAKSGSLGNTAKTVDGFREENGRKLRRKARFSHQRHAASLLGSFSRVRHCGWTLISRSAGVDLVCSTYGQDGQKHAHFEGTQTCGSVWVCPCCSARISETRRGELNRLLVWAREQGHCVQMITLTARHASGDDLQTFLDQMKAAKKSWAQKKPYRRVEMIGSVTATEVTHGMINGWHPHFHILVVTKEKTDLEVLREPWIASLKKVGLDGNDAAFQVQNASAAGRYIAKWGAAEELALTGSKRGRSGRTPAQLLAAACDEGDKRAGMRWLEYAKVFSGTRQLVWSRGLKDLAGLNEVSDEEAAQDEHQQEQIELGRLNIKAEDWQPKEKEKSGLQHKRSEILNVAEDEDESQLFRLLGASFGGKLGSKEAAEKPELSWQDDKLLALFPSIIREKSANHPVFDHAWIVRVVRKLVIIEAIEWCDVSLLIWQRIMGNNPPD